MMDIIINPKQTLSRRQAAFLRGLGQFDDSGYIPDVLTDLRGLGQPSDCPPYLCGLGAMDVPGASDFGPKGPKPGKTPTFMESLKENLPVALIGAVIVGWVLASTFKAGREG
jgi:hypothetical protein